MRPELRDPGRALAPPPRVVTVLGLYSLLGLLCLPALPVAMATAALLRTWTRLRPWLLAAVAAVVLAGELAAWRSPLFGGNLLSFHLSGWAMFSLTHPHVDVALWRMVFEAPVGLPLGVLLGAAHMLHSDHANRSLPWHPRTIQRTATSNARAGRQVARTLERMPPFVGDAPALGAVYDGDLPAWQHGPYAVLPRELRGRAITLAGAPGVGKTVLQRRLVSADAARGRRVVFIDAKATEPTLAAELIAAYTAGAGFIPRVKLWPAEPLSGWKGDAMELANRLLAVQDWSEPWYERVASRAIRLPAAPTSARPGRPRSCWPASPHQAWSNCMPAPTGPNWSTSSRRPRGSRGRRCATATSSTPSPAASTAPGATTTPTWPSSRCRCWPPARTPGRVPAAARRPRPLRGGPQGPRRPGHDRLPRGILRRLRRRPGGDRPGRAAPGRRGRGGVRRPVLRGPRGRAPGGPADGQLSRAHHPSHAPARAAPAAAGTIWTPEQTWQLDQWGPDGHASVRMQQRPLVDPDAVRRAEVGEAWIIAAGRSLHLQVAETPYTAQPAELPTPHRDGLAVVEERPPWVVDLPEQEPATATVVAGELPLPRPVLPPPSPELPRLRLQLTTAVREGDELALRRVLKRAARVAPTWDAQAELAALTTDRRRRRRNQPPAWRDWLTRIAHPRRTRP